MKPHPIGGPLTLIVVAQATRTGGHAAAVVVAHQTGLVLVRILAGADPDDLGDFGARRALRNGTAAAGAEETVERAVTPVFADGAVV